MPVEPEHDSEYVVVLLGATDVEPEVGAAPVQVPPADVQPVALVDDQLSFESCPGAIDFGLADRETVGDDVPPTRTLTESAVVYRLFEHVNRYLASDCG